jgi:hypothetical protein
MGILNRLGILHLPSNLDVIASMPVMVVAAVLYGVEFLVDKVPFLDTFWDGLHTVLRPAAGAFLSYSMVGHVDPTWQVLAALLGGSVALTSHAAKASTRVVTHVSPEPFSKWILSLTEDGVAFALVWLVGTHPLVGLIVVLVLATRKRSRARGDGKLLAGGNFYSADISMRVKIYKRRSFIA